MPAYRGGRHLVGDLIDRNLPWPSTILGVTLLLVLFLSGLAILLGTAPVPVAPSAPAAAIVITPDDPAAPTPVPVQLLDR